MPRFDGTGPLGRGAGSGRGLGYCGFGLRMGQGYGLGRRRFASPQNELTALEDEEKMLLEELAVIKEEKRALGAKK